LGKDHVGKVLPVVQPASVPAATKKGQKHLDKSLKELRNLAAKETGADEVKPLEIRRLSWTNIAILAGVIVALAIAIPGLAGVDWDSVKGEFEHADWGWVLLAAVLWPLIPQDHTDRNARARHRARVPRDHLHDPAHLRLLHAALAPGPGLRVVTRDLPVG
jgi:hypothetical protein